MSAVTDLGKEIKYDPIKKPGISNLLTIYSLFSGKSIAQLEKKFKDEGYEEFKKSLIEILIKSLKPFGEKRKKLLKKEVYIKEVLEKGAERARKIAQLTMQGVRKKMGLV